MIAFDGGKSANRAVDFVASGGLLKGLKATILSVCADTSENRTRLDAPVRCLRDAGIEVDGLLLQGEPDEIIGSYIETNGIRSLVIGSTTAATVRCCKVPS